MIPAPTNGRRSPDDSGVEPASTRATERARELGLAHGSGAPESGLVIASLNKARLHLDFAASNDSLQAVLISIEDARIFVEQGEAARSAFDDDVAVGVTTTIADGILEGWYPSREIEIIRDFAPDFYIPCDRPVYSTDDSGKRWFVIQRYLSDLAEIVEGLRGSPVVIVPLVKGVTEQERKRCYRKFRQLGLDRWAYYCTQYFLYGHRGEQLVSDVHSIVQEAGPAYLMLVGLQSEKYLARMPPAVFAAAGQRWIGNSGLRNDVTTMNQVHEDFGDWAQRVERVLSGGQAALDRWIPQPGGVYGD